MAKRVLAAAQLAERLCGASAPMERSYECTIFIILGIVTSQMHHRSCILASMVPRAACIPSAIASILRSTTPRQHRLLPCDRCRAWAALCAVVTQMALP
jgi:hypothetical protein